MDRLGERLLESHLFHECAERGVDSAGARRCAKNEILVGYFNSAYFVEEVRLQVQELFREGELYWAGLRIYTTLDHDHQRAAVAAAYSPAPRLGERTGGRRFVP